MSREFRKGTDLIKQAAENKGGGKRRFTPNIYWKAGDIRTIAFLTSASEIPKVRLHQMVRVPDDTRDAGFKYETFLCKKDPSMVEEFGGACELCDRVEHDAAERFVALAIELETVKEGRKVKEVRVKYDEGKNKDGEDVKYPRWGLVIQAAKNFFSYYAAYDEATGDIRDVAWEIHREGGSTDTKYHPFVVMNGTSAAALPDLSEIIENIPTLDQLLEEMGTEEKYAQVATVEAGSQPTFGNKSRKEESGTVPTGDRATEFAAIRDEVLGKDTKDAVAAY
jgi:hypothetical protein